MSSNYLIKRNPGFVDKGVIVKRKVKNKGFSETAIRARKPVSNKLICGDMVYVMETRYGIYAKGEVSNIFDVVELKSINEALQFFEKNKIAANYWMEKLIRFRLAKEKNGNAVLKYQKYQIHQELLNKTIPLTGVLEGLKYSQTMVSLNNEQIDYINDPGYNQEKELKISIPSNLRMDLYSLFNKKYRVQHWIDIDHFVPKSSGGPGNIIENLIPVGLSLNRYKSNSIPTGLFKVARDMKGLKKFCKKEFVAKHPGFLRQNKYPQSLDNAKRINDIVAELPIDEAKEFYRNVMQKHHPEYVKILESF